MTTLHSPTRLIPALILGLMAFAATCSSAHAANEKVSAAKPALTVSAVSAQRVALPLRIAANGNIAAWQEAIIGAESNGLRLAEVRVNVGDVVKRGDVLATFNADTLRGDLAEADAAVAEGEAKLAEAAANANRARELQAKGFISVQKVAESVTVEASARARVEALKAAAKTRGLRVRQTRVLAPDDGIISARNATVGAVLGAGQEMFRMIRQGRLEWRAEVAAADFARLKPGMAAHLQFNAETTIVGRIRALAPTIDPQTRNGIVYVDLPTSGPARAGMFSRGEFDLGQRDGLSLPQTAVLLREGYSYALVIGADSRVTLTKLEIGRRAGDRIEILSGLPADARVVAVGAAFLADGDTVRVVDKPAPASSK